MCPYEALVSTGGDPQAAFNTGKYILISSSLLPAITHLRTVRSFIRFTNLLLLFLLRLPVELLSLDGGFEEVVRVFYITVHTAGLSLPSPPL